MKKPIEKLDEATASDTELYDHLADKDPVRYTNIMQGRYQGTPMPKDYPKSVEPKFFQNKLKNIQNPPKMSATQTWNVIKQSMDKDELAEHYQRHPEDRPIETTPFEYDKGLTQMLGSEWFE